MLHLKRHHTNKFKSSKTFKRHNARTKKANVNRPVFRGGIRF